MQRLGQGARGLMGIEEFVDHRRDPVGWQCGRGVRVEQRCVVHVIASALHHGAHREVAHIE